MLSSHLSQIFGCWSCTGCDSSGSGGGSYDGPHGEYQIQLSTEPAGTMRYALTQRDSFDITHMPRDRDRYASNHFSSASAPITPRQKDLRDHLDLPQLLTYPVPPHSSPEDDEDSRKQKLLEMYQEFALSMHTGMYLTQLTSNRDYSDIHCQLMEDMITMKLDQNNGRIIEFPLTNVSKVYRIVKTDDKWYADGTSMPEAGNEANTEHIVVVEFMRRKLAFVFKDLQVAQRFLICMELLIRRAQQKQAKKALRSLTPTFPPQNLQTRQCPTPRQVQEAVARPLLGYLSPAPAEPSGQPGCG